MSNNIKNINKFTDNFMSETVEELISTLAELTSYVEMNKHVLNKSVLERYEKVIEPLNDAMNLSLVVLTKDHVKRMN